MHENKENSSLVVLLKHHAKLQVQPHQGMVPHHQAGHHQQHESGPQSCFRTETLPKNEKLENEETMENKNHLPEYKHREGA